MGPGSHWIQGRTFPTELRAAEYEEVDGILWVLLLGC